MNYQIAGFASRPVQISAVRTSATENISPLAAIPFSNQSFSAALIPKSVTTFVLTNVAPPATAGARQAW
jgi:O-glycosyl hydrolase